MEIDYFNISSSFIVYMYFSICFYYIALKLGIGHKWLSFIPIIQLLLLCDMAKMPYRYAIFYVIPLLNVIFLVYLWMRISKNVGKPDWLGILIVLAPFGTILIPGYLAFSK